MAHTRTIIRTCSIDGCEKPGNAARGWCWTHYSRWHTNGDPNILGPRGERGTIIADPVERFWSKVDKTEGCWYWRGSRRRRGGYGSMFFEGRIWSAHRLSYTWFVGPIPDGLVLDHVCREPACVRPDHLEPVTVAVNSSRAASHRGSRRCRQGHEMTGENRVVRSDGGTHCRECANEAQRLRRVKYRAERDVLNALADLPTGYVPDDPLMERLLDAVNRLLDERFRDSEW